MEQLKKDLVIFGGLAGMQRVKFVPANHPKTVLQFQFIRRQLFNFDTVITCIVEVRELKLGAVVYTAHLAWVDVDGRARNTQTARVYSLASLRDAIIETQHNISA